MLLWERGAGSVGPRGAVSPAGRVALLLAGALAAAALTGCSDAADRTPAAAGSASVTPSASPTPSEATPTPSPTQVGPTPTPGPSVVPKVKRPGQPSTPRVSARPQAFDRAVAYSDGIRLTVDGVTTGIETGQALGQFAGREYAVFDIRLTNGSDRALDLQSVVVTATYGSKNLVAERVYAEGTGARDFGGSLRAQGSADARYAFAVPEKDLAKTRLVVDFDGVHTSAEFRGDARLAG